MLVRVENFMMCFFVLSVSLSAFFFFNVFFFAFMQAFTVWVSEYK